MLVVIILTVMASVSESALTKLFSAQLTNGLIKLVFVTLRPLLTSVIFVEGSSTRVGSGLTRNHNTRLERSSMGTNILAYLIQIVSNKEKILPSVIFVVKATRGGAPLG